MLIIDNVIESLSIGVAGRNRQSTAIRRNLSLIIDNIIGPLFIVQRVILKSYFG